MSKNHPEIFTLTLYQGIDNPPIYRIIRRMISRLGVREFQNLIKDEFFHKDSPRGLAKTFIWFSEEIGELARAIRHKDEVAMKEEFADVLAWLCTLGNLAGIDLENAVLEKYEKGCPRCGSKPCKCEEAFK